jgi:Spy/CpxP family protein refolding chaperone
MLLLLIPRSWAQGPHGGGPGGPGGPGMHGMEPPGNAPGGMPPPGAPGGSNPQSTLRGGLQLGPPGRWWDDKSFAQDIGLRGDQKKKMDSIFKDNKGTLVNLYKDLEKQEDGLERLTTGSHLDEEKIFSQIDKVTQARAALEKANAHMLLQIRNQMSEQQVARLDAHRPAPPQE